MTANQRTGRHVELEPWEVGGELLDILSRGLYSDARDAIREYVQNGVDAGAAAITITVDGSRVVIRDDGSGMNEDSLRAARRFGLSQKSPKEMVGFRGIGIYSAFGMCEEMTISTRESGMADMIGWHFAFGEMRRVLEADRSSPKRQGISLASLLHEHTQLLSEPYSGKKEDHFTVVRLDNLGDEFRTQLNDADGMAQYLLNTVPVAYPVDSYGSTVNGWLKNHVGLNPVAIALRIGDEPQFDIQPELASDVSGPYFEWVERANDGKLAFVWYALSKTGAQISSPNSGSLSGFLMKLKGFTLGDRLSLKQYWPPTGGGTLYHHYTGEVHILGDTGVFPNAARDELEPSREKQVLVSRLEHSFDRLNRKANAVRAISRGERLTLGLDAVVDDLQQRQRDPNVDWFDLSRNAARYLDDLEAAQKELERQTSGGRTRLAPELTEEQQARLSVTRTALQESIRTLSSLLRGAQQKSATQKEEPRAARQAEKPSPQVSLLARSLAAFKGMVEASGPTAPNLQSALEALEGAVQVHSVTQAVGLFDDLKAGGVPLTEEVEALRKELRAVIGWSPVAPLTLEEALEQAGVSLETLREVVLARGVDRALLASSGGRGERYERLIRAAADAVAQELGVASP